MNQSPGEFLVIPFLANPKQRNILEVQDNNNHRQGQMNKISYFT